jgi:hypothetical protein
MSRRGEMREVLVWGDDPAGVPLFVRVAIAHGWRECVAVRHESDHILDSRRRWLGVPRTETAHRELDEALFPAARLIEHYRLTVVPFGSIDGSAEWRVTSPFFTFTQMPTLRDAVYAHIAEAYKAGVLPAK